MKYNKWFTAAVICAFIAAWGFFSINSAFADAHHLNWLCYVIGFAGVGGVFYSLRKV